MDIKKTENGKSLTIALAGRLDTTTAPELQSEVSVLGDYDELIFDLENLSYISSAGLRVLMVAHKGMSGNVKIKNANADIKEIFEITGFDSMFNVI